MMDDDWCDRALKAEARCEQLEAALKPFADWARNPFFDGALADEPLFSDDRYGANVGDLRTARAALATSTPK